MNGPHLTFAASDVHWFLLAEEIVTELLAGRSVVAVHAERIDDVLDLVAETLTESGCRVLRLPASADGASFVAGFAKQWRLAAGDSETTTMSPRGSSKRFVLVINQFETNVWETSQQLGTMAQAWPGMQMILAGPPEMARLAKGDGAQPMSCRVWTTVTIPDRKRAGTVAPNDRPAAPALSEPGQAPVARPPVRRAAKGTTFLGAVSLLTVLAVPRLPLNLQTPARGLNPPPASAGLRIVESQARPVVTPRAVGLGDIAGSGPARQDPASPPATMTVESGPAESTILTAAPATQPAPEPAGEPARTAVPDAAAAAQEAARKTAQPGQELSPALVPNVTPALAEIMTRRGLAMLEWGDVSAARLLLASAAEAGSAAAAFGMARTFDAAALDRMGAVGIAPDRVASVKWYRMALKLGDDRALAMLGIPSTTIVSVKPDGAK